MKSLAMLTLLVGALFLATGCETPGYTASEIAATSVVTGLTICARRPTTGTIYC